MPRSSPLARRRLVAALLARQKAETPARYGRSAG
jgi:hypothetical protein